MKECIVVPGKYHTKDRKWQHQESKAGGVGDWEGHKKGHREDEWELDLMNKGKLKGWQL